MPEPDGLTTIGYLFTARDMSSKVVTAAQKAVEMAEGAIESSYEAISTAAESVSSAVGASAKFVGNSFKNVISSAFIESTDVVRGWRASVIESVESAEQYLVDLGTGIKDKLVGGLQFLTQEQLTWGQVLGTTFDAAKGSVDALISGVSTLSGWFLKVKVGASSAFVQTAAFLSQVFALEKVTNTLSASGGLVGALLGPFAPILTGVMKLFSPLIDIIVEMLSPAIETFTALLKPAFAPLAMLAEIMAQQLAPLVVKFIEPFASLLEIIAVQAASFLTSILDTSVVAGPLSVTFNKVFEALQKMANAVLPALKKLFETLVPIITEVASVLMEVAAEILVELAGVVEEMAPDLIGLFGELLKAVVPIIKPLGELVKVLVKHIYAPVLKQALRGIVIAVRAILPVVELLVEGFVQGINFITESVESFWGDLEGSLEPFYKGFIQPIEEGINSIIDAFRFEGLLGGVKEVFNQVGAFISDAVALIRAAVELLFEAVGIEDIGGKISGFFEAAVESFMLPIRTVWNWLKENVVQTVIDFLEWDPDYIPGGKIKDIIGLSLVMPAFGLAEGGIVSGTANAIIGEAGPEAVVPLESPKVAEFVGPLAEEMEMPHVQEAVEILSRIERALNGTLRVTMPGADEDRAGSSMATPQEESELDSAVGMGGFGSGGGW